MCSAKVLVAHAGCANGRSDQELMRLGHPMLSAIGALILLPVRWLLLQPKRACQDQLADTLEWRSGRIICTVGHSASQGAKELEHWARGPVPSFSPFLCLVGRGRGSENSRWPLPHKDLAGGQSLE